MSRASFKKQQYSLTDSKTAIATADEADEPPSATIDDDEDMDAGGGAGVAVTRHLYLKPTHTAGTLDKQVILRRIRRRKRVNMLKSTINSLFTSATTAHPAGSSSGSKIRWVDDPFAAP